MMKKFFVGVKGIVKDERGYLLLHRDYKSGNYWDIPGGRIDGNEDFEGTLKRELSEELPGITISAIKELQGAFRLQKDIEGDTSLALLYFLVEAKLPKAVVLSAEHESYIFVNSLKEIPTQGLNPEINSILSRLLK